MPKIRNRGGVTDSDSWSTTQQSDPPSTTWTDDNLNIGDSQYSFPDIPLNPQHRYLTPPPLDPKPIDNPLGEYDDFPQYTARPPSPDDFDELTGARPPLPPRLGSRGNPIEVDDREEGTRRPRKRRQAAPDEGNLRRSSRLAPRATNHPEQAGSSSSPTSSTRGSSNTKTRSSPTKTRGRSKHPHSPTKPSPLSRVAYTASASFTSPPSGRAGVPN